MDRQEVFKVISVLKAVYNTAFSKYTVQDFENLASGWLMCLEDYDYNTVSMAVKGYMTTNTSQFPPVPAQIVDIIHKLKSAREERPPEASEAWALVEKAIRNSGYYAQDEFNKLPTIVQKAVGSADCLRTMATDAYFNFSKEKQAFEINYNTLLQRREQDRTLIKLPQSVRDAIGLNETLRIEG
jgi:hypothetical protein